MKFRFWKMHGAGNDFMLFDDRALAFPSQDRAWVARIAARRTGVGCDGVILLQPSRRAGFLMRFFNPDGTEAGMCGNGARCAARLAHELGVVAADMSIETAAGLLRAELCDAGVRVLMSPPADWRMERTLALAGGSVRYSFVNTGVPHAVVDTGSPESLERWDVDGMGREIRRHADFAPAGTNADFTAVLAPDALAVRTYERGVEAETLACGTGIVASALVAARLGRVRPTVRVKTAGGDVLAVAFELTPGGAENVTLTGPAAHVFEGSVEYR